jgi:peptide-methionine (S)-S-oxide reductase
VLGLTSGYAGGSVPNPSYEQVCAETTGHAEVVKVDFDPSKVSLAQVLAYFWKIHDPTQVEGQGNDLGTQYRSIILFADAAQKAAAEQSKLEAQEAFSLPMVTEIVPLEKFWPAEAYHQDYFNLHPERGYCAAVIRPKVAKLKRMLAAP